MSIESTTDEAALPPVASSPFLVVATDRVFTAKAPCPYCGGTIKCQAQGWVQEDDGSWAADEVQMECSNEPPIDSKKWNQWDAEHGNGDWCQAWHDMHEALIRSLKRRFRFDMENAGGMAAGADGQPLPSERKA